MSLKPKLPTLIGNLSRHKIIMRNYKAQKSHMKKSMKVITFSLETLYSFPTPK